MTDDRVKAIYTQLTSLTMQIDLAPERGPKYLLEALTECRRRQDQSVSLLVEVRRARTAARRRYRTLKLELTAAPDPTLKASISRELSIEQNHVEELATLEGCVNVTRSNLRVADSDIRLAVRLMEQQRQLGTVKPPAPDPIEMQVPSTLGHVDLTEPMTPAEAVVPETSQTSEASAADVQSFLHQESPAASNLGETMSVEDLLSWMKEGVGK